MQREEKVKNNINVLEMKSNKKLRRKLKGTKAVTLVALVITILFSYDEKLKFSNSKGFLLQTI